MVLSAGCDDFFSKPFRATDLFDMMHKHIGVRYIYNEIESEYTTTAQGEALTPDTLAALPTSLLAQLEETIYGGEIDLIRQVLAQISRHNAALATQLTQLTDDFAYDDILELIEGAEIQELEVGAVA